jgi:hypothetical protein
MNSSVELESTSRISLLRDSKLEYANQTSVLDESQIGSGSRPVKSLTTALARINSCLSIFPDGLIKTICKFLVFSMIAPFFRTVFVRIANFRVWGGHHISQFSLLRILQSKKTINISFLSFSLNRS